MGGRVRVDVNEELKFLFVNIQKLFFGFGGGGGGFRSGGGGGGSGWGGQVGCERRIEVFCENSKKSFLWEGSVGRGGGWVGLGESGLM